MSPGVLALFAIPFIVIGLFCVRAGQPDLSLGLKSKQWPAVSGTVQTLTPIHFGVFPPQGGRLRWRFYVRYHYQIDGEQYWGDWKSPVARTVEAAARKCGLKEGGPMVVYVCPEDRRLSVAVRGLTLERAQLLLAGGAFIIAPALLVIAVLTTR